MRYKMKYRIANWRARKVADKHSELKVAMQKAQSPFLQMVAIWQLEMKLKEDAVVAEMAYKQHRGGELQEFLRRPRDHGTAWVPWVEVISYGLTAIAIIGMIVF